MSMSDSMLSISAAAVSLERLYTSNPKSILLQTTVFLFLFFLLTFNLLDILVLLFLLFMMENYAFLENLENGISYLRY